MRHTELESDLQEDRDVEDTLPYETHVFQVNVSSNISDQPVQTCDFVKSEVIVPGQTASESEVVVPQQFTGKIDDNLYSHSNDSNHNNLCNNNSHSNDFNYNNLCKYNSCEVENPKIGINETDTCKIYVEPVNAVNDFGINEATKKPYLKVLINGKYLNMELDTGSSISSISKSAFDKLNLTGCVLQKCTDRNLVMADGRAISCTMHKTLVSIRYRGILKDLWLYVVGGCFQTLFGADWIQAFFGPDWVSRLIQLPGVNSVISEDQRRKMLTDQLKDHEVFKPGIGQVKNFEAQLNLKPNYRPKFCNARKVAYSIKDRLGEALDELEKDGRLVKVDNAEFASPVVPIVKKDGKIRVCGDYKGTLNPQLDTKIYPLPVLEDCFAEMKGGKYFTKLDIKQAYNQIKLKEEDQIFTTINTHQGLYKWTCLPYGISPAGSIFQATMDSVLKGMRGVTCRVDDILIQGDTWSEHVERVMDVVNRLHEAGYRCNWEKSEFGVPEVIYLGYELNAKGVKACRSKVETLLKAPYPDKLSTLISFLGAVQYYGRFIPHLSTVVEPLNKLRSSKEWYFGTEERQAFDDLKQLLASDRILTYYDPNKPLRVDADASAYGIGAVLSHIEEDGQDRPIEFISRTLTTAERNYSQIEKEALGIVWAIKRFHRYLYARQFELYTDHKPLEIILGSQKQIPEMGTSRIIRWALTLSHYQYTIKYRPTNKHGNADFCSRYPLPETEDEVDMSEETEVQTVFSTFMDEGKPLLSSDLISRYSKKDPIIAKVLYCVKEGWTDEKQCSDPGNVPDNQDETSEWRAFYNRRHELSSENNCLLWGDRVIIPLSLREEVLKLLHSTHMGMTAMKNLARNYVWWPKLDGNIESLVKHCETCQLNQRQPKKACPHPWRPAKNPWDRVHLDFAGPFAGSMWMLMIDAYSKWVEVADMRADTTSTNLIKKLRTIFSPYGLPKILVSDNGPQLISDEFESFCSKNGINHIPIPPYHPSSNGQIESIVGKFKSAMVKMKDTNKDMGWNVANWLVNYHNTPHSSTAVEPSVRMLGRRIRSALSLVHPLSHSRQLTADIRHEQKVVNGEKQLRRFEVGDSVLYRDVLHKSWKKGTILETSDVQYKISTENGSVVTKHIDHVVGYQAGGTQKLPELESSEQGREMNVSAGKYRSDENAQIPQPRDMIDQPNKLDKLIPHNNNSSNNDSVNGKSKLTSNTPLAKPPVTCDLNKPKRNVKPPDRLVYSKLGGQ